MLRLAVQAIMNGLPEVSSFILSGVVCLERYDVAGPTFGWINPVMSVEEKWLSKDSATDVKVGADARIGFPILGYAPSHLSQRPSTISLTESVPCERTRKFVRMSEDSAASNLVVWRVQFEQEQLACL